MQHLLMPCGIKPKGLQHLHHSPHAKNMRIRFLDALHDRILYRSQCPYRRNPIALQDLEGNPLRTKILFQLLLAHHPSKKLEIRGGMKIVPVPERFHRAKVAVTLHQQAAAVSHLLLENDKAAVVSHLLLENDKILSAHLLSPPRHSGMTHPKETSESRI